MSLYCFGKLKLTKPSVDSTFFPPGVMIRHWIDPGDAEEIEKFDKLAGDGFYFSIADDIVSFEATRLWMDMLGVTIRNPGQILETRLGRTVHALLFEPSILAGGVAFVDGGIETILEGTPEQCWTWFLERSEKPWDTLDNPMLIWSL